MFLSMTKAFRSTAMEELFRSEQQRGTLRRVAGWIALPEKHGVIVLFQDAAGRIVPGLVAALQPVLEKDWDDSVLYDDDEDDFGDSDLLDDEEEEDEDLFEDEDDFDDDFDDAEEDDDFDDDDYDEEQDEEADEEEDF